MERVQKIIASSGVCSRRKAEDLIINGKVSVNNKIISIGDKASKKDIIKINGKIIQQEKKIYYVLHKPRGYITTSNDMFNRKKVLDLVPEKPRVFSVGRLDRDANGILLLTNDGDFANKISHPSNEIKKTYLVTLDKNIKEEELKELTKGIKIDKHIIKAKYELIDKKTVLVTIHVGLHKIVKRLFKEIGFYVKKLTRTHIGNLSLDLESGFFRELDEEDIKKIFSEPKIVKKNIQEITLKYMK